MPLLADLERLSLLVVAWRGSAATASAGLVSAMLFVSSFSVDEVVVLAASLAAVRPLVRFLLTILGFFDLGSAWAGLLILEANGIISVFLAVDLLLFYF